MFADAPYGSGDGFVAAQGIAIHWPDASGRGPLLFTLDGPAEPGTNADAPMLK